MPIATGLEREELEAELQVRWSGPCSRGGSWNARPIWLWEMASDSSVWPGFCRGRSGLTWIPRSAPSVPRLVGRRRFDRCF
jgi:hypothetical protein